MIRRKLKRYIIFPFFYNLHFLTKTKKDQGFWNFVVKSSIWVLTNYKTLNRIKRLWGEKNMKVFYHTDEDNVICIDKNPLLSYQTLESGTLVMWHDKTINSLIDHSV